MTLAAKFWICGLMVTQLLSACDDTRSCTLMECGAPLTLVLAGAEGEPLPSSLYEIAMVIDGQPGSFICGDHPDFGGWFCEEPEGFQGFDVRATPDETGATTVAIAISRHDGGDVLGPDAVDIDIIAGDAPLVDTRVEPEYETSEPNGEGCGMCDEAVVETIEIALEIEG